MKVLVCGSRTMTDYEVTIDYVKKVFRKLHIDFSDQIKDLNSSQIFDIAKNHEKYYK